MPTKSLIRVAGRCSLLRGMCVVKSKQQLNCGLVDAGREEMQMIASALKRLPARVLWKLSKQEIEAAGGLEALNLTENVKVSAPTPPEQPGDSKQT